MITADAIIDHVERLASEVPCERIVLFGSYADGVPDIDSDVDLLVVRRYGGDEVAESARLRLAVPVDYPCDLLVKTPAWLASRLADGCVVFNTIVRRGITLHDKHDGRVGRQGRRRLRLRLDRASIAKAI